MEYLINPDFFKGSACMCPDHNKTVQAEIKQKSSKNQEEIEQKSKPSRNQIKNKSQTQEILETKFVNRDFLAAVEKFKDNKRLKNASFR